LKGILEKRNFHEILPEEPEESAFDGVIPKQLENLANREN